MLAEAIYPYYLESILLVNSHKVTGGCQLRKIFILFPIFIAVLTLNTGVIQAQEEIEDVGSRQSRHLILPMMGYQAMNSENTNFSYNATLHVHFAGIDTVFSANADYQRERSVDKPMFGLVYRFRPSDKLNYDFTFAVIQDGESQVYETVIDLWGNKQVEKLSVSRGNTTFGSVDVGYNLPLPVKFMGLAVSGGVGYAWRNIKSKNDRHVADASGTYLLTTKQLNAESMYLLRAGAELSLWKGNQMVVMGSIFYSQFIPTDDAIDPFGGMGWKLMIFPIWSRS
jgi:hypothetical protein